MEASVSSEKLTRKKVLVTAILFMGLAHIVHLRQYVKGALFALVEIIFLIFSPLIVNRVLDFITLGTPQPDLPVKDRDNSLFMLIDGVIIFAIIALFIAAYYISVRSALSEYEEYRTSGDFKPNKRFFHDMTGKSFPFLSLVPTVFLLLFFVVVPLVFSAAVAFTNYSAPNNIPPGNTIDWVGFENFISMFGGERAWTSAFTSVAIWTIVWAIFATFTCYFGGMLMAIVLHESKLKIAPVFRSIFILPYAVPAIISMLVWAQLLNGEFGVVNRTLLELGIISSNIPWLSDVWMARFMAVMLNLWAGFPYFMLLVMGTMTSISSDIYEAAKIDGASQGQLFRRITFPLVTYQTMPLIIMSFAHNINNFGAIFFLFQEGGPTLPDTVTTSARGVDIMITWIYKLTVNLSQFNYASVLAVTVFMVLAPFAIFNFMRTKSYKEGDL